MEHCRTTCTARTIACSLVASKPDYCNSLLYGAAASTIDRLQKVQVLSRVVNQCHRRTDARPLLKSLHWLPVRKRISYKVALLTKSSRRRIHRIWMNCCSLRLQPGGHALRSSDAPRLAVPRTRTTSATRGFALAAPTVGTLCLLTLDSATVLSAIWRLLF